MNATVYMVVGIAVFLVGVMVIPEYLSNEMGTGEVEMPEILLGSVSAALCGLLWPLALAILSARLTARYIRTRLKKENRP